MALQEGKGYLDFLSEMKKAYGFQKIKKSVSL